MCNFDISALPSGCEGDEAFFQYIKDQATKTVKLRIGKVSNSRPKKYIMKDTCLCGTGYIVNHHWTTDSDSSLTRNLELDIATARHVLCTEEEVKDTRVELFFDDDTDTSGVVCASGVSLTYVNEDHDESEFTARLDNPLDAARVMDKLSSIQGIVYPKSNVTFAVSHLHGMAKRVTFGSFESKRVIPPVSDDVMSVMCDVSRGTSGDKHVLFYYIFNRVYYNTRTPTKTGVTPDCQLIKIVKHLIDKRLIDYPSDDQLEEIHSRLKEHFEYTEDSFPQMKAFRPKICINSRNKSIFTKVRRFIRKIVTRKQAESEDKSRIKVVISEGDLSTQVNEIQREFINILNQIWRGDDVCENWVHNNTFTYRLNTCPASSGARVFSFTVDNDSCVRQDAPHSRSMNKYVGASGRGAAYLLRSSSSSWFPPKLNKLVISGGVFVCLLFGLFCFFDPVYLKMWNLLVYFC